MHGLCSDADCKSDMTACNRFLHSLQRRTQHEPFLWEPYKKILNQKTCCRSLAASGLFEALPCPCYNVLHCNCACSSADCFSSFACKHERRCLCLPVHANVHVICMSILQCTGSYEFHSRFHSR